MAVEPVDGALDAASPAGPPAIRRTAVQACTTRPTGALRERMRRFRSEPGAWWNSVLVAEVIEFARRTHDVTRAPRALDRASSEAPDFHTPHFGGRHILRVAAEPMAIACEPLGLPGPAIRLADRDAVAPVPVEEDLAERIVRRGAPTPQTSRSVGSTSPRSTAPSGRGRMR